MEFNNIMHNINNKIFCKFSIIFTTNSLKYHAFLNNNIINDIVKNISDINNIINDINDVINDIKIHLIKIKWVLHQNTKDTYLGFHQGCPAARTWASMTSPRSTEIGIFFLVGGLMLSAKSHAIWHPAVHMLVFYKPTPSSELHYLTPGWCPVHLAYPQVCVQGISVSYAFILLLGKW